MGERLFSTWSLRDVLDPDVVDLVQLKITRIGGILERKKVAALAEARSVKVAPHDGSAGPIAAMANLHLRASIPNLGFLEHRAEDVPWRSTVVRGVVPDRDGHLTVPDRPGLGLEIHEEECAKHPLRPTDAYQYHVRTPDQTQTDRLTRDGPEPATRDVGDSPGFGGWAREDTGAALFRQVTGCDL